MAKPLPAADPGKTRREDRPLVGWSRDEHRSQKLQDNALAAAAGMSIEADAFNVLILNYTMKCSLACDFCCYGCTPKRTETMSLPFALDLVDQAASLGVFAQGGFTGGEPLLFLPEIKQIAARMHSYGMKFSMISACDWAKTDEAASATVNPLADLGMEVLSISYDPTHGKWVPQDNVRRVIAACARKGVNVVIAASFYSAEEKLQNVFPDLVGDPNVELVNRLVLPTGNARNRGLSPQSYQVELQHEAYACYKRIYHDLTVFWDGEVYPCCSVFNRATPGLSLGNLYERTLAQVWDRLEGSLMFRCMKRQGFSALYDTVRRRDPSLAARLPDPGEALGPCELCHRVFKDEALAADIASVFTAVERDRIRAILASARNVSDEVKIRRMLEEAIA